MNPGTPRNSEPFLRAIAWGAVLATTLPEILWQETGHAASLWLITAESLVIAVSALAFPRLRPLTRFLLALALLNVAWGVIAPMMAGTKPVQTWSDSARWGTRLFIVRTFTLSGVVLGALTLIGSGITRRDLFLRNGDLDAPAQPIRFLGMRKPVPWTWFGPALIVVFAAVMSPFLYLTVHPNFGAGSRIIQFLPWIVAVAALNAASEEFQFRCLLLAHLRKVFSPGENVLLTAAFFGLGHFYGQPSGTIGVLMTGFAGWIWARSMIETRGWFWALAIHMVQDIVVISFLVVGAGM
ncbi:MAG TPA: CPBP family intramembrane glutamic endopeptidase [Chthoniobacterales bacterium]|jgi:membrane protease YdiL (CAAX protease family)|nr:CPBP family intramembrane glutamic endopeptidase [Chthoniobacterales bacterium]